MRDGERESGAQEQYRRESYSASHNGMLRMAVVFALLIPLVMLAQTLLPEESPEERVIRKLLGVDDHAYVTVAPVMDLEEIWALEDTRTQAETPLVTAMRNGGDSLGYDAAQETFYCTLGLETGEDWPELSLGASGAQGVQVVFVDDYAYDWCSDAIREGYRYELFAYTETEFSYLGVVFTGLPIVSLHVDGGETIDWGEDLGAQASIAAADYDAISSYARVHQRGGSPTVQGQKTSYRLELHTLNLKGEEKKSSRSVLGMEADSDWLLIGSPEDETCIANYVAFEIWRDWYEGEGVAMLESRMVELFINDEYMGLYQLMQRIDPEKEMAKMGADPDDMVVVRKIGTYNEGDRPRINQSEDILDYQFELRYAPAQMTSGEAFEAIDNLMLLEDMDRLSDEEYMELAAQCLDMKQFVNYVLFFHACSLEKDNVFNNVYIWAERGEDGVYRYRLSPWDMDLAFRRIWVSADSQEDVLNPFMVLANRTLGLNAGGCRELLWEIWNEKRSALLTDDAVYQRFMDVEEMINASGAYLRESERWQGAAQELDLSKLLGRMTMHLSTMDRDMLELWPLDP